MRDQPENITVSSRRNDAVFGRKPKRQKYDPRITTRTGPFRDDCDLVDRALTFEPAGFTIWHLASNIRVWIRYRQRLQF
jgi:hypothetical protein